MKRETNARRNDEMGRECEQEKRGICSEGLQAVSWGPLSSFKGIDTALGGKN